MEPNESQLSSYFHHHHQQNPTATPTTAASPTNGLLPSAEGAGPLPTYPHPSSVPSSAVTSTTAATTTSSSPLEGALAVKRKRGRPRKYGTPEQALAAKKAASAAAQQQTTSSHSSSSKEKKDPAFGSSRKSLHVAPGGSFSLAFLFFLLALPGFLVSWRAP